MLDIVLRYHTIVKIINKLPHKKVLEIGSDDYGIAPFLNNKQIVLFDTAFRRKNMRKVTYKTGSVLQMPFKDNTFDIVVSVDMLEHIPPKLRNKAISELVRVSKKYLFFAFPADEPARQRDKKVYALFSKFKNNHLRRYIAEHIENGLPDSSEIVKFIETKKVKEVTVTKNLNINIEYPLVILSNLDFIPILILQKMLDPIKKDILPFFFRLFMTLFGWTAPLLSFGDCYRVILIIRK